MGSLAAYDSLYGTNYIGEFQDRWMTSLRAEFTDPSGKIIGLRSSLLGLRLPFPSSDLEFAVNANTFAPDLARRLWALGRDSLVPLIAKGEAGEVLNFPDIGIDYGNYRLGARAFVMSALYFAACEFGDGEVADISRRTLEQTSNPVLTGGSHSFASGSNMANIMAAQASFTRAGDNRKCFSTSVDATFLNGPVLAAVDYKLVSVARAVAIGEILELELVARDTSTQSVTLEFAQLKPECMYVVEGANVTFETDRKGQGTAKIALVGRRALAIKPDRGC
jgi:hypothetical protein